mgnify:CR=1 FL=1
MPAEPQAENEPAPRRIWLCADDYGISPSVSKAIRDLIMMERLNATSVMVLAPSFNRSEAASLNVIAAARRAALGRPAQFPGKLECDDELLGGNLGQPTLGRNSIRGCEHQLLRETFCGSAGSRVAGREKDAWKRSPHGSLYIKNTTDN